jgi:hypothetical protein
MSLPTVINVTGTLVKADGTPESGHVYFQSQVKSLSSTDDTVVVPSILKATLDASGKFSLNVPASNDPAWSPSGWTWLVTLSLTSGRESWNTVVPYDASGGTVDISTLLPAMGGGSQLYAAYNHVHSGGGSGSVTSVNGRQGAVTLTKTDVGLANVDNTSDANKPISTATQTALNGLDSRVTTLEGSSGGGTSTPVGFASGYVTSGDITPGVTASFTPVSGLQFSIPAVAGDRVEFTISGLVSQTSSDFFDMAVLVSGSPVRYSSTGTSSLTTTGEGDPSIYPMTGVTIKSFTASFGLQVTSGDLSSGNVTFALLFKGSGTGKVYASTNYPFRWSIKNFKQ